MRHFVAALFVRWVRISLRSHAYQRAPPPYYEEGRKVIGVERYVFPLKMPPLTTSIAWHGNKAIWEAMPIVIDSIFRERFRYLGQSINTTTPASIDIYETCFASAFRTPRFLPTLLSFPTPLPCHASFRFSAHFASMHDIDILVYSAPTMTATRADGITTRLLLFDFNILFISRCEELRRRCFAIQL